MEHNTFFKLTYTFILGIVVALLLGVGVQAFYESPKAPEYPSSPYTYKSESNAAQKQEQADKEAHYERASKIYNEEHTLYERNASIILLLAAVATVACGLLLSAKLGFLSDGILLGGLFTLVHALIRGFGADDAKYLFVAALVSVAVILYLGYHRFIRTQKSQISKLKK